MRRSFLFLMITIVKKTKLFFLLAFVLVQNLSMAQQDSVNLYDLSLDDLMNVSIISASREKEDVYDAPVTAYVITRQDIEKSGSLSIPEALRICPSLFVTEITNGVY